MSRETRVTGKPVLLLVIGILGISMSAISSVFAALLFGELPTALQIAGGVIVLAGVVYYTVVEVKTGQPEDKNAGCAAE